MKLTEEQLKSSLKAGKMEKLYFLYGSEPFLTETYADRIIRAAVGDEPFDLDLQRFDECPEPDVLTEYLDSIPVFAERKVVAVKDLDAEELDNDTLKRYIAIMNDVPDTSILLIYCVNVEIPEEKKGKGKDKDKDKIKAKTKKLIEAADKNGAVCSFGMMTAAKVAALCVKKAAAAGIVISPDDAQYLVERSGGKMNAASDETAKLMTYAGKGGTITRANIDALVPKQLDAVVYDLAEHINAGRRSEAYRLIDELDAMKTAPELIMGSLAGAYIDIYGAKTASEQGIGAEQAAPALGFYGGRVYALKSKIYPAARKLDRRTIREMLNALAEADITMKSNPTDRRTVTELAVTRLFAIRERRRG